LKISVCMATFNGARYLRQQLESILSQLGPGDEIIISDDSSSDETTELIRSFQDNRIVLLENNKFYSPIYNVENALKKCSGHFIFLSDQDDIWRRDKVAVTIGLLEKYDLVVSDCELIDAYGNVVLESFFAMHGSGKGFFKNFFRNSFLGCCMAFNRKILERSLPFPKNIPMHDIWLGLIACIFGKPYFAPQKLVKYRRHVNNASSTSEKSRYGFLKKIQFRFNLLASLIKRVMPTQGSE